MDASFNTYLAPKLGLAKTFVQADLIVPFNQANAKLGRNEILCRSLHLFNDIVSVDYHLNMLGDCSVSP